VDVTKLAAPDWCLSCLGDGPLRPWPLPDEWGDTGELVCGPCWLRRVRGEVTCQLLGGELVVWSSHPQRGRTLRGAIRAVGIVPGGLQPAVRWQITGPRQDQPLGEHVGDYADAQARLLAATADRDQIQTEEGRR
jgi:hypothetical protein